MPSAAYLAQRILSVRDEARLIKIELTDPSTQTLYLSNRPGVFTPGAPPQYWQPVIDDVGPVVHQGSLGSVDPALATFDFHVAPIRLGYQAAGDTALDSFAAFYWYGAKVTLYEWMMGSTDIADLTPIFTGVVIDPQGENLGMRVTCQQRNSWVQLLPADTVNRIEDPRAPEASIGMPKSIAWGDLRDLPARPPADPQGLFKQGIVSIAGIRCAGIRGVVTRMGAGGGITPQKGRVVFAAHACDLFNDDANGSTPAIEMGDRVGEIDPTDPFNTSADGAGFDLQDITSAGVQPFNAFYPVFVTDSQQPAANNGENPRAATDPFNDTSYARMDYTANLRELNFPLPALSPQGAAYGHRIVIGYQTSPGATHLEFQYNGPLGPSALTALPASTTPNVKSVIVNTVGGFPAGNGWQYADYQAFIQILFSGAAPGEWARIFYVGAAIWFRPNWPIFTPASGGWAIPIVQIPNQIRGRGPDAVDAYEKGTKTFRVDSTFYATLRGRKDDGGGTATGVANALVERPPDMIRDMLVNYCGESTSDITSGGGNHGDFDDVRADLKTWRLNDMKLALAVDDFRDSSDVLRDMCAGGGVWAFISTLTDKWKAVAWKPGATTNAPRKLRRWDLMNPSGPKIIEHRDDVVNDLAVRYAFDAHQRRTICETFVGKDRSSSGHIFRALREESCTVIASRSDRIDFSDSGGNHVATLTAGSYTPIGLAIEASAKMSALHAHNLVMVAWGFQVSASYNDKLDFNDGSARTGTLNAGTYTGATMAVEVARAMNAVSSNWSCTYSSTTYKFTISRSSGTAQLKFAGGANVAKTVATMLGYIIADKSAGSPYVGDFAVEVERYAFGALTDNLILKWETGANGIDAATPRGAGVLFGFDMARDYDESATFCLPQSPANAREQRCAISGDRYGKRTRRTFDLRAVRDTETAREMRNRLLSWWEAPPVEIQFQTERAFDFDLGHIFEFDATLDEVQPFTVRGTDGSWVGKQFIVTGLVRHSVPTSHQELVAFLVPAS